MVGVGFVHSGGTTSYTLVRLRMSSGVWPTTRGITQLKCRRRAKLASRTHRFYSTKRDVIRDYNLTNLLNRSIYTKERSNIVNFNLLWYYFISVFNHVDGTTEARQRIGRVVDSSVLTWGRWVIRVDRVCVLCGYLVVKTVVRGVPVPRSSGGGRKWWPRRRRSRRPTWCCWSWRPTPSTETVPDTQTWTSTSRSFQVQVLF